VSVVEAGAVILREAQRTRTAVNRLTSSFDLTLDDAYRIQREVVEQRIADGESVVGYKLGLTARAKQIQMGVDEPIFGYLLSAGRHPIGDPLEAQALIHPRAEPEIVFVMGSDVDGATATVDDVLDATAFVHCGLEILDSRYTDFSFTLNDVVADNGSDARFVVGTTMQLPRAGDFAREPVRLIVDGVDVARSSGAATLGSPAVAVVTLARWLARQGRVLDAGSIVFTGALSAAVPLVAGTAVSAQFGSLGSVSLDVA
jgi:2-oxo-3-hexenedioate decarboxylase